MRNAPKVYRSLDRGASGVHGRWERDERGPEVWPRGHDGIWRSGSAIGEGIFGSAPLAPSGCRDRLRRRFRWPLVPRSTPGGSGLVRVLTARVRGTVAVAVRRRAVSGRHAGGRGMVRAAAGLRSSRREDAARLLRSNSGGRLTGSVPVRDGGGRLAEGGGQAWGRRGGCARGVRAGAGQGGAGGEDVGRGGEERAGRGAGRDRLPDRRAEGGYATLTERAPRAGSNLVQRCSGRWQNRAGAPVPPPVQTATGWVPPRPAQLPSAP